MLFESNFAQLESSAVMVSFELVLSSLGLSTNVTVDRMTCSHVLNCASMGRAKFADMQKDFHRMCVEQEEAARAAAKYKEELFN